MKRPLDQLAEIAQQAVGIGDDLIKMTRPQAVIEKSDRDTYTDVDIQIQRKIRAYLAEKTPEIGFIGEEEDLFDQVSKDGYFWALDPIDGTANFVHDIPLCAVQIALLEGDITHVAAVRLPFADKLYWATKDGGSYVNSQQIHVSRTETLKTAIVAIGDYATGEGASEKNAARIQVTAALADRVERIRMLGSAAHDLVWVAEGRLDAAVILSNNIIDVAAGVLIAREAGALVFDTSGDPHTPNSDSTIAASPGLANSLYDLLNETD